MRRLHMHARLNSDSVAALYHLRCSKGTTPGARFAALFKERPDEVRRPHKSPAPMDRTGAHERQCTIENEKLEDTAIIA